MAALLVVVGLAAYLPSLRNGFVWDDDSFLTANALMRAPDGLARFWFTTQATDYWPVTSTSLWLEWRLWGTHAAGYHAANLALHLTEALLLWSILRRLRVPGAYLAAMLFAVHPVNVESVAWIAQRKNLMAMLFYLLSIFSFLRTGWQDAGPGPESPEAGRFGMKRRSGLGTTRATSWPDPFYWLSLFAFILAMLSKGSVAPLPLVLLGIIGWRRRLAWRDLAALAPFFAVSAGLVAVNIWFQTHGAHEVIRQASALQRLLGAAAAIWFYLSKAVAPFGLIFVYPQWHVDAAEVRWWLPLLATVALTVLLGYKARLRSLHPPSPRATTGQAANHAVTISASRSDDRIWRACLCAWLYFCALLLPVLGFTDVFFMRYSLVADHYQHLAIIGVFALAGAGWEGWRRRPNAAARAWLVAVLAVGGLGFLTWRQTRLYRDEETLYRATLERSPASWMVYNNLGLLESRAGRKTAARRDFEQALRLNPDFAEAHLNRGELALEAGRFEDAIADFNESIRLRPNYPEARYNLGAARHGLGRNAEAVSDYEAALRLRPAYPDAENNLGTALVDLGRIPEAIRHFERAVQLDSAYAGARYNLANTLAGTGRDAEAIAQYAAALRLKPDYPEAENNLALAYQRGRRLDEAISHFQAAVRLRPDYLQARNNLGVALAMAQRLPEARAQFQEVLRRQPDYAPARQNMARLRAMGE